MDIMSAIHEAMQNTKLLNLTYQAKDGKITSRTVEPYEFKDGGLYAFDTNKESIRKFMLDGIKTAEVSDIVFTPRWPIII